MYSSINEAEHKDSSRANGKGLLDSIFPAQVALRLASIDSLEEMVEFIGERFQMVYPWDTFAMGLRKSTGRPLLRIIGWRDANHLTTHCGPLNELAIHTCLWCKPVLAGEVLVRNASNETLFNNAGPLGCLSSVLAIPLFHDGQSIGMLTFQSRETDIFAAVNLLSLAELGSELGSIVFRCSTEERMRGLLRLGERLNAAVSLRHAAMVLINVVDDLVGWDACAVHMRNKETGALERILHLSDEGNGAHEEVATPASLLPFDPTVLAEMNHSPLLTSPANTPFRDLGEPEASVCLVPIHNRELQVGLLSIYSSWPGGYTGHDTPILQILADHCGNALERTRVEESLFESEERYRLLIENVNDGIVISQNDYLVFFNTRFAEMLGYDDEELRSLTYKAIYTDQGLEILMARYALRHKGDPVPSRYETIFQRKDGSHIEVEANVTIIEDFRGSPATFAVIRDITERKEAERLLERSEAELRSLFIAMTDVILVIDKHGVYQKIAPTSPGLLVYPAEELLGHSITEKIPEELARDFMDSISDCLARQATVHTEYQLFTEGGNHVWFHATISPVDAHNVIWVARNITEQRQADLALKISEERYALAVEGANDGIWDWDLQTDQIFLSARWWSILGENHRGDQNVVSAVEWFDRVHPEDLASLQSAIHRHCEGFTEHLEHEFRILHRDKDYRWVQCRGLCVRDTENDAARMAGSMSDVTTRRAAVAELQHGASHDALTGLPNRTYFLESLARAIIRTRRFNDPTRSFAVLYLDIDRFKVINDSLGHLSGDEILMATAQRLLKCVRPGDIVARMGGDEFTVLLEEVTCLAEVTAVAERISSELIEPIEICGYNVQVGTSIGIAIDAEHYERPEELLRDADTAMYRAKAMGRSRYQIFDQQMHAQALQQLHLELALRRALENEEFFLVYQPIIFLEGRKIAGFEALIRWRNREGNLIMPAQFISLAEDSGLIVPIGYWVLRQAARQAKIWRELSYLQIPVSVNLSGRQFSSLGMAEIAREIFSEENCPTDAIALEITESVLMDTTGVAVEMLHSLKKLGFQLHLDDFGMGYSSLSYLHRLPLDVLKLDRSFIEGLCQDVKRSEFVSAIIMLGKGLNLELVAEGIETAEQADALQKLGCRFGQGYHFSGPMEVEDATRFLLSHSTMTN